MLMLTMSVCKKGMSISWRSMGEGVTGSRIPGSEGKLPELQVLQVYLSGDLIFFLSKAGKQIDFVSSILSHLSFACNPPSRGGFFYGPTGTGISKVSPSELMS